VSRRNGVAAGRASTSEKRAARADPAYARKAAARIMIPAMRAYVGLGSNLGARERTLRAAIATLDAHPAVEVNAVSTLRETDPVGPVTDQPRFLNGAVALETSLSARALLELLLAIEADFGRTRDGPSGGPRTLDLDLLLYGDERIDEPGLQVPHPRLHERVFVLEPLAELGWTPRGRGYTAFDEPPR
jgi:2-amino-4-hydroxy-6-hydroxymethyldihydropteridine diphosphokinase